LPGVDFVKEEQGPAALRALLLVEGQWYYFGRTDQAEPIVEVAHRLLFSNELPPRDQTQLACAYVAAVGEGPLEVAQERWEEVFRIEQALRGEDEPTPLPRDWTQAVRRLHDLRHQPVIDRLRSQSRILEPHQKVSGFASRVVARSFYRSVQDLRDEDRLDEFR